MRAAWGALSRASRVCRLSSASIATCPRRSARFIPKWKTPYISILVQAVLSGTILVLSQIQTKSILVGYQLVVRRRDHSLLHSVPVHVRRGHPPLAHERIARKIRMRCLCPEELPGCGFAVALGFVVVLIGIIVSFFPPGETTTACLRIAVGWWNGRVHPDRPVSLLARRAFKKGHLDIWR